ncbi:MAG: response regulator [Longimicrobiales bacterium]
MQRTSQLQTVGLKTRILLAEDHSDSRDALRALLEAFGFEVLEAINGRQAVDVALAERPGLILMDVMMPEMDGFEAIGKLRQSARTRATPIIVVTATDKEEEALAAGANAFLRKPVDIRKLIGLVNSCLTRKPM